MTVTIKDIFEAMPSRFNGAAAGDWSANIQFNFNNDGDGENWFVTVADGAWTRGGRGCSRSRKRRQSSKKRRSCGSPLAKKFWYRM